VSWLWIFLPVALVVIAAVVGLPLWQSVWARDDNEHQAALDRQDRQDQDRRDQDRRDQDRRDRLRREAMRGDATPQSRPQHVHH
jgi:hypothetical protein